MHSLVFALLSVLQRLHQLQCPLSLVRRTSWTVWKGPWDCKWTVAPLVTGGHVVVRLLSGVHLYPPPVMGFLGLFGSFWGFWGLRFTWADVFVVSYIRVLGHVASWPYNNVFYFILFSCAWPRCLLALHQPLPLPFSFVRVYGRAVSWSALSQFP